MLAWLAALGWYMRDEYPRQRLHFWYSVKPVVWKGADGFAFECPALIETSGKVWPT